MDPTLSHSEFEQLAAGFVLGALEPDDEHTFEQHLQTCEACSLSVRELEEVIGKLAYAVPPVEPPATLRASIMREVGGSRRRLPRLRAKAVPVAGRAVARPGPRIATRLAVAAGVVALVLVSLWNVSLQNQNDQVRGRLQALELAAQLLNDPQASKISLTGPASPNGASATVLASSLKDRGVLLAEGLPPTTQRRVYELWSIPQGQMPLATKAGVFRASGSVQAVAFALPLQPNTVFAITEEPGPDGSQKPTSSPILVGQPSKA